MVERSRESCSGGASLQQGHRHGGKTSGLGYVRNAGCREQESGEKSRGDSMEVKSSAKGLPWKAGAVSPDELWGSGRGQEEQQGAGAACGALCWQLWALQLWLSPVKCPALM